MTMAHAISVLLISLYFYVFGWFCVFKTSVVVAMGRRYYGRSKLARSVPNSGMVFRPWYPTFIRCCGIFIWLWALTFDVLFFAGRLR